MKYLFGLLALVSLNALADDFHDVSEELCPEIKVDRMKKMATCKATNANQVLLGNVGDSVKGPLPSGFNLYNAIEIGIIPDDSSSDIYFYTRWLLDKSRKKKIGVLTINGWQNSEWRASGRVDVRYNMKGEIVSITLKDR